MNIRDDDPWAPHASRPPAPAFARPPVVPSAEPTADRVVVDAVEAEPSRNGRFVGRVVAVGVAAMLVGGGALLAFGALSADGGAPSPEAAWEQALAAINDEDMVALAEIMEPSERDTLFAAGFAFVDELVRLDVLDDGIDVGAVDGIDLRLDGFEPRVEVLDGGLAHVYLGAGTIAGEVDVAALPLGELVLDRLDAEQSSFAEAGQEAADPASTPLVAVERDGRWYLSLWYTVAENIRLELGSPPVDPLDRPAAIGGSTPEAAVRLLVEEAVQLDVRRLIGALDPEEMAVLYDYAPLLLDDIEPATNTFLEEARASGWTWGFDSLDLSTEALDDGLARVSLRSFDFAARAASGSSFVLTVGPRELRLDIEMVDEFFGDRVTLGLTVDGECIALDRTDATETASERLCGDELADTAGLPTLDPGETLAGLDRLGFVTRQVDGGWYISPIRTGLDAMVTAVERLDPETLAGVVDEILGLGGQVLDGDLAIPSLDLDGGDIVEPRGALDPLMPPVVLVNDDLLSVELEPSFAFDLDPVSAQSEFDFWAPDLGVVDVARGVYATVPSPTGDVAIVSVELAGDGADDVIVAFAERVGAPVDRTATGDLVVDWADPFGDPIIVQGRGSRLHLFGVYGASVDELEIVAATQTTG